MTARSLAPIVLLAIVILVLVYVASFALDGTGTSAGSDAHDVSAEPDAGPDHDAGGFWSDDPERFDPDGAVLAAPSSERFACRVPRLAIQREAACERGEPYPACRWQVPDEDQSEGLYGIWRNTTPQHRWARPGLVALVLASVREYAMRWPGERVTIGDLDAEGPRHQTHDHGVDVDLYLLHAMADRNEAGRPQADNYHGLSRRAVRLHRARVLDLAKILASCSAGRLRIYYADREVVDAFRAWFTDAGLHTDVAPQAMQMHNDLHRFHFHVSVAEDLAVLPSE